MTTRLKTRLALSAACVFLTSGEVLHAESAFEAAYALVINDGDYKPMPAGGYSEKKTWTCENGKDICFMIITFTKINDCRYVHSLQNGNFFVLDTTYGFSRARSLEFRNVKTMGSKDENGDYVQNGPSIPGVSIDGEDGFVCIKNRNKKDEKCWDKNEAYLVQPRTTLNARPNNQTNYRKHWATLRQYCKGL